MDLIRSGPSWVFSWDKAHIWEQTSIVHLGSGWEMATLILPHASNRHVKCLQLQRLTEKFCKSFSVLTSGLCALLMICKYLHYLYFELCQWLLRYVGEFGHKDSQNAFVLVTVITKSLKHHKIISNLRPNEFISFCLEISLRPIFTCYFLCGFILCAFHWEYVEIALIFEWIQGILEAHFVLPVFILIFSLCFENSTLEWNFLLSSLCLSFCVSVCLFGLNPEHLIRQGLCSHSTIPSCYLPDILPLPVCSHIHSTQSSPSVMN